MALALAGAVLVAALVVLAGLRPRWDRAAPPIVIAAIAVALLALSRDGGSVVGGTTVVYRLGEIVPGTDLLLRIDQLALLLLCVSAAATLLWLLHSAPGRQRAALLLGLISAGLAATAGTVDMLTAASGLAVAAVSFEIATSRGRINRGGSISVGAGIVATLFLGGAAALLHASVATTDLATVPSSAATVPVTLDWAIAGVIWLLGGALGIRGSAFPLGTTATTATPLGVVILVRLSQTTDGGFDPLTTAVLVGIGFGAALWGARRALAGRRVPARFASWAVVATAGMAVGMAGIGTGPARAAFAAFSIQLGLMLAAAHQWAGRRLGSRFQLAAILLQAGWLPVGAGFIGLLLAAGAAAGVGATGGALLLLATLLIATALWVAGIRCALAAIGMRTGPWEWGAALPVLLLGAAAVVVPGFVMATAGLALAGADAAGPSATYVLVDSVPVAAGRIGAAAIAVLLAMASTAVILDRVPGRTQPVVAGAQWRRGMRGWRRMRGAGDRICSLVLSLDRWLGLQPQFGVVVVAVIAAVVLIR